MASLRPPRTSRAGLALAVAALAAGLGATSRAGPLDRTIKVGIERHFLLVVPGKSGPKAPLPLVFVFHGAGNTGAIMQKDSGIAELAGREGFIAAFPDGIDKRWNGGASDPQSLASAQSDDVAFVSAMIDMIDSEHPVDRRRVFAAGSSNGGIFCYTLACRLADRIAAIAPISGLLGEAVAARYHPSGPVSVISFNGTDDPLVPFAGEPRGGRGLLSVNDTVSFWVRSDRCAAAPTVTRDPPSPLDDGLTIIRMDYEGGTSHAAVEAFIIGHGGHTWPGNHTDPTWAKTAGKTAMSISANELMWGFFERHPKP